MLKRFMRHIGKGAVLYIRIKSDWLSVRDAKTGYYYEDMPLAALKKESRNEIVAVGFEARELVNNNGKYRLVNGFDDKQKLISNRHAAEGTLKYFMDGVIKKGLIKPPIKAILHPTDFEKGKFQERCGALLQELALKAGAAEAYVWTGRELMYKEILDGDFPGSGCWITEVPKWAIRLEV